ncbi:GtrA family protein [Candidatus Mycalebacterium sp.]
MKGQFFRFLIAGGVNTAVTYAIYFALLYFLNPYWSYAVSFVFGIFISYFLNLKFTFRAEHSSGKAFLYLLIYPLQFLLGILTFHISLKAGIHENFAVFFAAAAAFPFKFLMSRWVLDGNREGVPVLFLSIFAFAVSIAAAYGALLAGDLFPRGFLFSSDFATLYLMWNDISSGAVAFRDIFTEWNFQRVSAPYIFTDLPLIWIIYSITGGNLAAGIHVFGILIMLLNAVGWLFLCRFIFRKNPSRGFLVFILLALTYVFLAYGLSDLFGVVFFPVSHFSTWSFVPFCVFLFLSAALSQTVVRNVVLSVVLAMVCAAVLSSDIIFAVWFVAPAFAAAVLILILFRDKGFIIPTAAVGVGFVCARFARDFFIDPGDVTIQFSGLGKSEHIQDAARDIVVWFSEAALRHPFLTVVWIVFFALLVYSVLQGVSGVKKPASEKIFTRLFLLFTPPVSVMAAILTGNFFIEISPESSHVVRYFIPALFIPLFAGWAFLPDLTRGFFKRSRFFVVAPIFLILAAVPGVLKLGQNSSAFSEYYTSVDRCFDENASRFGLKKGLSTYWWGKSIMAISESRVEIGHVSVYPDPNRRAQFFAFQFGVPNKFFESPFDFVITNNYKFRPDQDFCEGQGPDRCRMFSSKRDPMGSYLLSPTDVVRHFGITPSSVFECGGAQILVFK